jgi:hypothetical protein
MPEPATDLVEAVTAKDGVALERAIAALEPKPGAVAGTLAALLSATWHQSHEDLARLLQDARDPDTVDALFHAATLRLAYLDYNNSEAFNRKCIWALVDVGTPDAKSRLAELARIDDPMIAGFAQRRLDRWERELSRKGPRAAT